MTENDVEDSAAGAFEDLRAEVAVLRLALVGAYLPGAAALSVVELLAPPGRNVDEVVGLPGG